MGDRVRLAAGGLGLTPTLSQSGASSRQGAITKAGASAAPPLAYPAGEFFDGARPALA